MELDVQCTQCIHDIAQCYTLLSLKFLLFIAIFNA